MTLDEEEKLIIGEYREVRKNGHGQLLVKVFEGKLIETETTKRKRPK